MGDNAREPRTVFIIHGHDERNAARLQSLLQQELSLTAILLSDEPGQGRTIIEKFEQVARRASYAVALLTADDLVTTSDEEYRQARPNVLLELGWFYGHLGRDKVCIIKAPGVEIPSDIRGLHEVRFTTKVEEAFMELHRELRAAGLVASHPSDTRPT